ncbi:hypothetical protein IWQ62_001321 [Dispira parvispora]|uniref:Uncharacterized protein n=1 Tax=Dispira parvispora TaxID=1520584 RepID=A0A9W8AWD3_9FUNG|nr:hypothetical protein IWQ62_001321 [Dispira parvispora]
MVHVVLVIRTHEPGKYFLVQREKVASSKEEGQLPSEDFDLMNTRREAQDDGDTTTPDSCWSCASNMEPTD